MHLDQQTIAVVMMVFFCSTLIIAAGLVFALRASEAGRLWAFGHVLVSAAGLALAISAASGTGHLGTLGALAFVAGWLLIYRGVRVYYGVPAHPAALAAAGVIVLGLIAATSGMPDGQQVVLRIVYGLLALVSLATFATLARAGRGRRAADAVLCRPGRLGLAAGAADRHAAGPVRLHHDGDGADHRAQRKRRARGCPDRAAQPRGA